MLNKLEYQLFIGKVSDIIGKEKTMDLLNECRVISNSIKSKIVCKCTDTENYTRLMCPKCMYKKNN